MPCPLAYYVYYSQQKITQLYKQLPESMVVAQKASLSCHDHIDLDHHAHAREEERRFRPTHHCLGSSQQRYSEACFEPNEMYYLRQVLGQLRRTGQLCRCRGSYLPGRYYEARGRFTRRKRDDDTPEGSIWLEAPEDDCCPAMRLLCGSHAFLGENEHPWREVWACGEALPLKGAVLCMAYREGTMLGLPLYLAIDA